MYVYVPQKTCTNHLYNICTTSAQRLRRWNNLAQMFYKCFVFLVTCSHIDVGGNFLLFCNYTATLAICLITVGQCDAGHCCGQSEWRVGASEHRNDKVTQTLQERRSNSKNTLMSKYGIMLAPGDLKVVSSTLKSDIYDDLDIMERYVLWSGSHCNCHLEIMIKNLFARTQKRKHHTNGVWVLGNYGLVMGNGSYWL